MRRFEVWLESEPDVVRIIDANYGMIAARAFLMLEELWRRRCTYELRIPLIGGSECVSRFIHTPDGSDEVNGSELPTERMVLKEIAIIYPDKEDNEPVFLGEDNVQ